MTPTRPSPCCPDAEERRGAAADVAKNLPRRLFPDVHSQTSSPRHCFPDSFFQTPFSSGIPWDPRGLFPDAPSQTPLPRRPFPNAPVRVDGGDASPGTPVVGQGTAAATGALRASVVPATEAGAALHSRRPGGSKRPARRRSQSHRPGQNHRCMTGGHNGAMSASVPRCICEPSMVQILSCCTVPCVHAKAPTSLQRDSCTEFARAARVTSLHCRNARRDHPLPRTSSRMDWHAIWWGVGRRAPLSQTRCVPCAAPPRAALRPCPIVCCR